MARRIFVLGGYNTPFIGKKHPDFIWPKHPDFGVRTNPTLEETIRDAVLGAFASTGVSASSVEKMWIGNFVGELFSSQGHLGAALVGVHPDLMFKPSMRVEGACASGGLALYSAVESIKAGTNITLVVGAEVQSTASARTGGDYLARASHYARQRHLDDFTFPALFASRVRHCQKSLGVNDNDLGLVSVKAYSNANKNPLAHMKSVTMTLDKAGSLNERNPGFLSAPELKPFMKMSDCSQVSDGGSAIIVVSEEGLRMLGKSPSDAIELLNLTQATGNLYEDCDPTRMETTEAAARLAFGATQLKPSDIAIAEVHDCFTITELLMYEALGFAKYGEGTHLIREGHTQIDGRLPVNTGGGLVGFGHPVGATGVKQVLEIYRQMKGLCEDYQVKGDLPYGLTANMGGNDKTVVMGLYKNID